MRAQQWRRDVRSYGFVKEIQSRYADVDMERHLNNAAVQGLHTEACIGFQMQAIGVKEWQWELLQQPVTTDTHFLQIAYFPAPVQCGIRVTDIADDGCTLALGLFQDGVCVGLQDRRIALWVDGKKAVLPATVRDALLRQHAPLDPPGAEADLSAGDLESASHADQYPAASLLTPRLGDLDSDWCLSAFALGRYVEQARTHVLADAFKLAGVDIGNGPFAIVLARSRINFLTRRAPLGSIGLAGNVIRIGGSSIEVRVAVFDDIGCIATSDNVMVLLYRENNRPAPIPVKLRNYLEAL
jgi:acyl-CoA thioesterase FadM